MGYQILAALPSSSEAEAMISVLNDAGHTVDLALSIDDAMKKGENGRYDLVIIDADFVLSEQGWQLARQIRHSNWGKTLGIIILTRSSPMNFMHKIEYQNLYNQVLFFPISIEELLGNIERVMKFKRRHSM